MPQTVPYEIDFRTPDYTQFPGVSRFVPVSLTDYDLGAWELPAAGTGKVWGLVRIPHSLASPANPKIQLIVGANATTGNYVIRTETKVFAIGESYNPAAMVNDTSQTVAVPATARLSQEVLFTGGDLANVAAGKFLLVGVTRSGDDAADTLNASLELLAGFLIVDIP